MGPSGRTSGPTARRTPARPGRRCSWSGPTRTLRSPSSPWPPPAPPSPSACWVDSSAGRRRPAPRSTFSSFAPLGDLLMGISGAEARWASEVVLPLLNGTLRASAAKHGWTYVDGIAAQFGGDGFGHGFGAGAERWVNTAGDGVLVQGSL